MLLKLNERKCSECGECLANCSNRLTELSVLKCKQCSFEEAACINACRQGAFYEIAEGIIGIDEEACNGCGECIKACEENAIQLVNGKAAKCDLCAKNGFMIACLRECGKEAISLIKTVKEVKEIEGMLGFRIKNLKEGEIKKILKEREEFEVIEKRDNERIYILKDFPELTKQEAKLFREVMEEFQQNEFREGKEKEIYFTLMDYCERNLIELEEEQEEYLLGLLESMIYSFGPLKSLLENDEIEEISVIGLGEGKPVRVFDRNFGWVKTNLYYCSETAIKDLVNKMARRIGRRLTLQTPKLNAVLPDGSRINATIPPVSFSGATLTIRKFKKKPFTPIELIENKTFSLELMAFIWIALQTDISVLVVGNTGSGKTSSLNALFCFIPKEERIVVVEETPEIILPQKHLIKLSVSENLGIGMQELITDTLRMRPDRVIVGEIRSREEVGAFIDTLLAGQGKGSYATFHAQSSKEAIARMEKLGVMEIDLSSIDLVLVQKRWNQINKGKRGSKEVRRIVEVSEVMSGEEGIKIRELYSFNHRRSRLQKKNESEKVMEKIKNCFRMNEKEVRKELMRRKRELNKLGKEKLELRELFERMNSERNE